MVSPHAARFLAGRAQHLGFLRVLCRDEALAEELFQDLALTVLQSGDSFQEERGEFDTWVRGIARNLWRNHLRRRKPTTPLDAQVEERVAAAWDDRSPAEALERQERLGRLHACLQRLAPAARELLASRYERGESSATIAASSGRTPGAIDTALCRIRSVLLDCLGTQA